jgi:hypothetical protein
MARSIAWKLPWLVRDFILLLYRFVCMKIATRSLGF